MGKFVARDVIFDYLRALEIDYLFGVPGTNEIPIIDGTSKDGPKTNGIGPLVDGIHYIPCLHENIAMGAAMGYARMAGKPGVVMLHVTPGIGHALGNLFNAYKSHIPVLVLCGQQHSKLILQEPLLASETVKVAEQYTKWAYEIRVPEELPLVMQRALKLAITPPMGPVFISVPWDYTIQPIAGYKPGSAQITRIATNFVGAPDALLSAASILKGSTDRQVPPVIIVGDGVGAAKAWDELQMVAQKTGAYVFAEGLSSMMNYPPEDYHYKGELPPLQEKMQEAILNPSGQMGMPQTEVVFLCGFNAQAQIVAYDYNLGQLIPESIKHVLYLHNDPWEIGKNRYGEAAILGDIKLSLARMAELLPENLPGATKNNASIQAHFAQSKEHIQAYLGQLDQKKSILSKEDETIPGLKVAQALGELQKERSLQLVLINEAISDAGAFQNCLHYTEPTSYFCVEGGSLGFSMPASIGTKLAAGETRVVVNVVGDGSALFYPHAWWTVAKYHLPILYIITNNREYKTLMVGLREIDNLYGWKPERPAEYLDMHQPPLVDFHKIAESMGIEHSKLATSSQSEVKKALGTALDTVMKQHKPYVLEILTDPKLPPLAAYEQFPEVALVPMEVVL